MNLKLAIENQSNQDYYVKVK